MAFSLPANIDFEAEQAAADARPNIRLFTVGTAAGSLAAPGQRAPQRDLAWFNQGWTKASALAVGGCNPRLDARCMTRVDRGRVINCSGVSNQLHHCAEFGYFSAVAWFFGKRLYDAHNGTVPIGLISANWGGTALESWATADAFRSCGGYKGCRGCRCATPAGGGHGNGALYNSIIAPYAFGPMALSGFVWYQGEANTATLQCAQAYACLFPAMIRGWRGAFNDSDAFFGFVQLSTFGCTPQAGWDLPRAVPQLRDAQMAAASLHNVGWVTNADWGAGCNVHPPRKEAVGVRLANAALDLIYDYTDTDTAAYAQPRGGALSALQSSSSSSSSSSRRNRTHGGSTTWRSPRFKRILSVTASSSSSSASFGNSAGDDTTAAAATVSVTVELQDAAPLTSVYPLNYGGLNLNRSTPPEYPSGVSGNCTQLNLVLPGVCAWAAVQFTPTTRPHAAAVWVNATAAPGLGPDHSTVVLTAAMPTGMTLSGGTAVTAFKPRAAGAAAGGAGAAVGGAGDARGAAVEVTVTGTSYGYGPVPMMNLYTVGTNLPVLPWNTSSEVFG